uniref:Gag-pol polyprotein n=1 Tax=Solanum tuberosum TaxID=4113 RepID=M1DNU6_SOLTU
MRPPPTDRGGSTDHPSPPWSEAGGLKFQVMRSLDPQPQATGYDMLSGLYEASQSIKHLVTSRGYPWVVTNLVQWKRSFKVTIKVLRESSSSAPPSPNNERVSNPKPQGDGNKSMMPTCAKCGRNHEGKCLVGSNACFGCGKMDQNIRNCPLVAKNEGDTRRRAQSNPSSGPSAMRFDVLPDVLLEPFSISTRRFYGNGHNFFVRTPNEVKRSALGS